MTRDPLIVAAADPMSNGDELGRTIAVPISVAARAEPARPARRISASVERYRLEHKLGEGAMGVVHVAFDPNLQRRVALKVLRSTASSAEAKDRLLREARAMARLAHPNVVTVHEVGTANGGDYIAMELIRGETLADWLRSEHRRSADIVEAFVAAGRGLAAAHAAGIVHRDFKPHNVLRDRQGRIVVTDFGLAREAQADLPLSLEATLPVEDRLVATPESSIELTSTGALLGTPAYMAPEQWVGGPVTPATDQFAFCVALWEALCGERPYRGRSLDELRRQVALGPGALDVHRIPRRLRAILRRGLDPDPLQRWPNMDVLLARIVRIEHRPRMTTAITAGSLVAAGVLTIALLAGGGLFTQRSCEPPMLDPEQVWSANARAGLSAQPGALRAIGADVTAWRVAREGACHAASTARAPQLACLDGVIARIDIVANGVRLAGGKAQVDAGGLLIDPKVCESPRPPRLMTSASAEFRNLVAIWLAHGVTRGPQAAALLGRITNDPCASSLAHLLAADTQRAREDQVRQLNGAQQDAERCGDDRVLSETALASARYAVGPEWPSVDANTKMRLADAAVRRVAQRDLTAALDGIRGELAKRNEQPGDALKYATEAMEGFAARGRLREQIRAALVVLELRQTRGRPEDLVAIPEALAGWRARARAELGDADDIVRVIDARIAEWTWRHGEIASADAELERVRSTMPNDRAQPIAGVVVDLRGVPVAGATVTAGVVLYGDSLHAAIGLFSRDSTRSTKTGPDGTFELPDAVENATVIAELGDLRSVPAASSEKLTLQLEPTRRIEGHVDLAGQAAVNVVVVVRYPTLAVPWAYGLLAPVTSDGSFSVDGVPRREVRVFVGSDGLTGQIFGGANITVMAPVVRGVSLSLVTSKRIVHVLVRSTVNTRMSTAQIVVLPGNVPSTTAKAINQKMRGATIRFARQLDTDYAPKEVVAAARSGDLYATIADAPEGLASACAIALPEMSGPEGDHKVTAHLEKIQVICSPIPENAALVTIEVPPFPRLD